MEGLTEEQKEHLRELVESETWPAVLALLEKQVSRAGSQVLSAKNEDLVVAKAKYDGARDLGKALASLKDTLKPEPKIKTGKHSAR